MEVEATTQVQSVRSAIEQLGMHDPPAWLDDVRIVMAGVERVDELEPLWQELRLHHIEVADPRRQPIRTPEEGWEHRRAQYSAWLEDPDAFLLLAELRGELVGYLFARPIAGEDTPTWVAPTRSVELETVAIREDARDMRIGALLSLAVKYEAWRRGYPALSGQIIEGNDDAIRFYKREGGYFKYVAMEMLFDPDAPPPAFPVVDERVATSAESNGTAAG